MGSQSVGHNWATLTSLSHLYMTTGKTIDLIICTFVGKWMSLLFNALSRFVISFLPMSKHLWIFGCSIHLQWFWSPRKQDLIWAYFLKFSTNCSLEKPSWLLLYLHGAGGASLVSHWCVNIPCHGIQHYIIESVFLSGKRAYFLNILPRLAQFLAQTGFIHAEMYAKGKRD